MSVLEYPTDWDPRPDQMPLWMYLQNGGKRAAVAGHRRWGKDDILLRWAGYDALQTPGTYWHMLPKYVQARKAIWDAVNPMSGKRRIDEAFPPEIREDYRDTDMFIRFKGSGSTWQVVGSDSFDSLVGSPPRGVTYSEYALANPRSWAILRPILAQNGGWAAFISTPRGRNHFHGIMQTAREEPNWYGQVITVDQTNVFSKETLEAERRELHREYGQVEGEALYRQEYYCDFNAAILGSYYSSWIEAAEVEGRVVDFQYDPAFPVVTAWDLGWTDSTVIWCMQQVGPEYRILNCISGSGAGLEWYVDQLKETGYRFGEHILPHDGNHKLLAAGGRSIRQTLQQLGVDPIRIVERERSLKDMEGINAVRRILPSCVFHKTNCERGLEALRTYRREYDEDRKCFSPEPYRDWTTHYADAMRMLAMGYRPVTLLKRYAPTTKIPLNRGAGW